MAGLYRIADEPIPGRLAGLTVNPFFPLLAVMVGGFWLAVPWFALNGAAMGSATRRREWLWLAGGLLVTGALGGALLHGLVTDAVPARAVRYAVVALVALRLVVAYAVFTLQQASFELHRHFGGLVRNGVLVLVAAALVRPERLIGRSGAFLLEVLVG